MQKIIKKKSNTFAIAGRRKKFSSCKSEEKVVAFPGAVVICGAASSGSEVFIIRNNNTKIADVIFSARFGGDNGQTVVRKTVKGKGITPEAIAVETKTSEITIIFIVQATELH